jgi:Fe2+ or Zn2+ uptake regulation protein
LLVDVDVPVALIARHVAEEQSGFAVANHHTMFAGMCPECMSQQALAQRTGSRKRDRSEQVS